jgi:conjugal transfer pilin signal peptidase TrbI
MNTVITPPGSAEEKSRWIPVTATALWLFVVFLHFAPRLPLTLALDPNREKCLPDFHLALLVRYQPASIVDGDLVTFKPTLDLAYVQEALVLKKVVGVAGQHVRVHDQVISIDGHVEARGLPLAGHYVKSLQALERDEVIPPGKLFVLGTAANSDDSRYWGYVDVHDIEGRAIKLF